mgnify:CR=1 FL=1
MSSVKRVSPSSPLSSQGAIDFVRSTCLPSSIQFHRHVRVHFKLILCAQHHVCSIQIDFVHSTLLTAKFNTSDCHVLTAKLKIN